MSGQHARLSASAAHRWMVCAGSVGPGGETTLPAAEGTLAHDIAARCLKDSSLSPSDFFLKRAKIDGHEVECGLEMVEDVRFYIDQLDDDLEEGDITWVEMPLLEALQRIDPDLGGTADYVRYRPSTQHLRPVDFKYGAGVYVEVFDNEQLKTYALGVLLEIQRKHGFKVKDVEVAICQPRYEGAAPFRTVSFKAVDLLDFAADLQEAAERTRAPGAEDNLVAGDHCQFCPKARFCKELERKQTAVMALPDPDKTTIEVRLIAAALPDIPLVKQRLKALEAHAYKLACQGIDIPGHKLVNKIPRRKWKRDGDVIEWAQANAIDPYAPREILSPSQMEEKIKVGVPRGKKKEAVKVLEKLYEKISSGTALVPVTDDRPAVKRVDEKDFAVVDGAAKPALPQSVVNLF